MLSLLLRWSVRDFRSRWLHVSLIALVVAVGTGMYAGLMSTSNWSELSYDASYDVANMHDLRVQLTSGSLTESGSLAEAVRATSIHGQIAETEERLLVPIQVDASTETRSILVRGILIGVPLAEDGPRINRLVASVGRTLAASDTGAATVVIERNFGSFYELEPAGELTIGGGRPVSYVGQVTAPEYYIVQPPDGGFFGQSEYAAVFTSLESAQELSGLGTKVNDLLITLTADGDADAAALRLEEELTTSLPDIGAIVTTGSEDPTLRLLYDDLEGDRRFFSIFAILIFAGAVAGAFNLTSRMVEATRREIGIAMALGVPRSLIALRPLMIGAQIAFLGVALGIVVGRVVNLAMGSVLLEFLPLPVWRTPFIPGVFLMAGAIGFVVPFLASAVPVWRAVRVNPIDAIRTGHLAARAPGGARLLRVLPGDSMAKMPVRNLVRAPRRTVLTVLGVAAAVTVLIGMIVMVDSFLATVDKGEAEVTTGVPGRIIVALDTVRAADSPEVRAIVESDVIGEVDPGLRVPGSVTANGTELPIVLEVIDLESSLWHPTFVEGGPERAGIILAEKAASDLGVTVGDTVTLTHPRREGPASFTLVDSEVSVAGLHPHPFRFISYLDDSETDLLGTEGLTNSLSVDPAEETSFEEVQRALFDNQVVASVQKAGGIADVIRDFLAQFMGILRIAEYAAVALMFLIAFNASGVAFEERARENATMMAFGVGPGRILTYAVFEGAILGIVAVLIGVLGGFAFVRFGVMANVETTMPDILLTFVVTPGTVFTVLGLGIGTVAAAPLLNYRRLRHLDIPSTLRVME